MKLKGKAILTIHWNNSACVIVIPTELGDQTENKKGNYHFKAFVMDTVFSGFPVESRTQPAGLPVT